MLRVAIAFTSREGQTEKIAHHVARLIEEAWHLVRLVDIKAHETEAGIDDADALIVAGSIHRGRYDADLAAFIKQHLAALTQRPSVFLTVSLSAASTEAEDRATMDKIARGFLAEVGWAPQSVYHVAGAVHDRRLNVVERYVLRRILESKGVTPHPSGDTELTDWTALDVFVRGFIERAIKPQPTASGN